jgi:acyl-CoA reductase-like NAD-dependent aldehyde dehydrogenase
LATIDTFRRFLSLEALAVAEAAQFEGHPVEEILVAELLPILEACRFLKRKAFGLLKPKPMNWMGAPWWLGRVSGEIRREAFGVVAVISPSNYPLFLGAVHSLQALAAGNSVIWKPAPGCDAGASRLVGLAQRAGIPAGVWEVLPEAGCTGQLLVQESLDKVVFTGGAPAGKSVLSALASRAVPAIVELSGCDAVFVRADADLDLVVRALAFGLRFNRSRTCIAPRRVFVPRVLMVPLVVALRAWLKHTDRWELEDSHPQGTRVRGLLERALGAGASLLEGGSRLLLPDVVLNASAKMELFREDIPMPLLGLFAVESDEEALALAAECPLALGASVFTRDIAAGKRLAACIKAGCVTINDLIVPTADPRVPFGGAAQSGFGSTRGAEGLLEMTRVQVVQARSGTGAMHLSADSPSAGVIQNLITLSHPESFRAWLQALAGLLRWGARRRPETKLQHPVSLNP